MYQLLKLFSVLCLITLDHGVHGVKIPPEWVHLLKVICDTVESSTPDVLGPPLIREVSTFSSVANLLFTQVGYHLYNMSNFLDVTFCVSSFLVAAHYSRCDPLVPV